MTVLISEGNRRCDARCYNGKGPRCRCICGGKHHGKGKQKIFNYGDQLYLSPTRCSSWAILNNESTRFKLVIRDIGHDIGMSVTNDAEHVVDSMIKSGHLTPGRRLFYYDSTGQLDEIRVVDGKFAGFAPGPRRQA